MSYMQFLRQNARWLLVGFLLCFTSSYGQTFFISIFAGEIRAEFGLSHSAWGWIYSAGTTASAATMIWAGVLTDHFRVRTLAPIVLGCLALACLTMASVPSAGLLICVIFALRLAGQGMSTQVAMVAMSRWFQTTRGRALSLASLGTAFGNATLPLIFVTLMAYFSWRQLWLVAAVLAIILVPLLLWLLREERTPQSMSQSNSSAGMNGKHWSRKDVFGHWLFWFCAPLIIGPPTWGTVLFFQQVPLVESKGWLHVEFVGLFPWLTLGSICCTFLAGIAVDRWGAGRLLPIIPIPFALGFMVLAGSSSLFIAGVGLAVTGIGLGIQSTIINAFWAEHYGTRNIGSIKSAAMAIIVFGSAIGPGISGMLLDKGVRMSTQFQFYAVYFILSAGIALIGVRRARSLLPHAS